MKVHLIKKLTINEYLKNQANARNDFEHWMEILKHADWDIPSDILKTFPTADILGKGLERVVFNIGGNKYRLIAKYYFGIHSVRIYIKWIGIHKEYDKLCKEGKQYFI